MNKFLFIIFLLISNCMAVVASPVVNFMWSEIAITTEGGTKVKAKVDLNGNITKLSVAKNNWNYNLSTEEQSQFKQVALNSLKVFEEPNYDYALLVIRSGEFNPDSGDLTKEIEWSLNFKAGKLENIKNKVIYEK